MKPRRRRIDLEELEFLTGLDDDELDDIAPDLGVDLEDIDRNSLSTLLDDDYLKDW